MKNLNDPDSIMARFEKREVSEQEKKADKIITLNSQKIVTPDGEVSNPDKPGLKIPPVGVMTKEMEQGHIDSIALCRIMVERNDPNAELWAIELLDMVESKQYFKVVNSDVARSTQPPDMTEDVFQTMMVNSVVAQVKADENIPEKNLFYCLFIADARKVAEMLPGQMHAMYMQQVVKLRSSMEIPDTDPKEIN